jgi:hypothetical protein
MSSSQSDWIRNRIIWRAKKNSLLDKRCCLFDGLDFRSKQQIEARVGKLDNPVLAFYQSKDCWTVLTCSDVISYFSNELHIVELKNISTNYHYTDQTGRSPSNISKLDVCQIHLVDNNTTIWAPPGNEAFALASILHMFPSGNVG